MLIIIFIFNIIFFKINYIIILLYLKNFLKLIIKIKMTHKHKIKKYKYKKLIKGGHSIGARRSLKRRLLQ